MKKQHKIVSLLLVISLLLGSIVFTVSADSTGDDGANFTPTAQVTQLTSRNDAAVFLKSLYTSDTELMSDISITADFVADPNLLSYKVNSDNADYLMVVPSASAISAGKIQTHSQINFCPRANITYDASNNKYYVLEFDIATESTLLDIYYGIITRTNNGANNRSGANIKPSLDATNPITNMEPGKFHHITFFGDINNNIMHVYMDNVLVKSYSNGIMNNDGFTEFKSGVTANLEGMRIQLYTDASIKADNSYCITNLTERLIDTSDELGNTASYAGKAFIADWDKNVFDSNYDLPVMPDLVEIDGTRYNNTEEANRILSMGTMAKDVTILRDCASPLHIACSANIKTNGYSKLTYGNDVDFKTNGNTVTVTNTTLRTTTSDVTSTPGNTDLKNATASLLPNNMFHSYMFSGYNASGSRNYGFVTDSFTGNKYFTSGAYDGAVTANPYFNHAVRNLNGSNYYFTFSDTEYFIYEFDIAMDDYTDTNGYMQTIARNSANSPLGGTGVYPAQILSNAGVPEGTFAKMTLVVKTSTKAASVFVNGIKVSTVNGFFANSVDSTCFLDCIRWYLKASATTHIDNVYATFVESSAFAADYAGNTLSAHLPYAYNNDTSATRAPIAIANGVAYDSVAALNATLITDNYVKLEFLTEPATPVTINADCTICTNGMNQASLFTMGTGAKIESTNGNLVYVSAPDAPSVAFESVNKFDNLKDTVTANNRVGSISEANPGALNYFAVDAEGDDASYYMVQPKLANTGGINSFINVNYSSISITTSTVIIFDLDVATLTDAIDHLALNVINRSKLGGSGFDSDGTAVPLANYVSPSDEWSHLTLVVDFSTNKQHVFINGTYAGECGKANDKEGTSRNGVNLSISDHIAAGSYSSSSLRINMPGNTSANLLDTILVDNICVRGYASNAEAGDIQSYVANGSLAGYANAVQGHKGRTLPALATVNGVDYATPATLSKALISNDKLAVEFHYPPFYPTPLLANATIDTSGYSNVVEIDPSCISTIDGDIITTTLSSFLENKSEEAVTNNNELYDVLKYDYVGNIFGSVGKTSSTNKPYDPATPGIRIPTVVNALFTGETIYHETSDGTAGTTTNNEFLNIWNNNVIPIHSISGQNQYFVMDVDVATAGSTLDPINFTTYVRTGSTLGSGTGLWGGNITFSSILSNPTNKMVHLTVVFDLDNNNYLVFADGVYKANGKVMSDAGHNYYTGADTSATAYFHGMKFGSNSNMDIYLNNYCMRYYTEAESGPITTAVTNKNLSTWSADFLTSGYETPQLPAIARVDGVECYNAEEVASVTNDAFLAGKLVNIELLHNSGTSLTVNSSATVDTHGFSGTVNAPETHAIYRDGNIVTVTAPNMTTEHENDNADLINATKSNVANNLFTGMNRVNYATDGLRGSYIVTNLDSGNKFGYDGEYNTEVEFTGSNSYFEFRPDGNKIPYELGNNQYIVYDFDLAIEDYADTFPIAVVSRHGGSGVWGNNISNLSTYMNTRVSAGDFAHITLILSGDTREMHLFINNTLVHTQTGAIGAIDAAQSPYFEALRFCGGFPTGFFYDNVAIRTFTGADGAAVASAVAAKTLTGWANGVYVGGYAMPEFPAVATVDGNKVSESELAELFTDSRTKLNVTFRRLPNTPITISVDATINTRGWAEGKLVVLGNNTTAELDGTYLYVDGPFVESSDSVEASTSFPNLKDTGATGSIVTTFGEGNPGSFNYFEITDYGTSNPYYMINPKVETTTANTFITVNVNKQTLVSNSYVIFEMDVATETDFVNDLKILNLNRTSGGGYGDGPGVPLHNYLDPADEWAHVAIVFDYADNTTHVFVNGKLTTPEGITAPRAMSDTGVANIGKDLTLNGFRINIGVGVNLSTAQSTLIDNVSVKHFSDNASAGNIESYISAQSLDGYANVEEGRGGEALPTIATVNGVSYGNVNTANRALTSSEELFVTLEKTTVGGGVTISAPATLEHNGISYNIASFLEISSAGDVVIISALDDIHVSVTINGTVIYDADVAPGTDINKVLAGFGSVGNVVAGSGEIFTNVSWSKAPGVATEDTEYVGSGTKYNELFYVYDQNGKQVTDGVTYTADNFRTMFAAGGGKIQHFILNGNLDIASGGGAPYSGHRYVYLNGYEISYSGGSQSMTGASTGGFTMSGPGTVNDMNHTSTHYLVFGNYDAVGTYTFKDLEINLSSGLTNLRGGNLVLDNCTVNAMSIHSTPLVQIGEMYNQSYTNTATSLSIIDSYVNYRSYLGNTVLIKQKISSGYVKGDVNSPISDPFHSINIDGSTIITEAAFAESYETAEWIEGKGYTACDAGDGVVSNLSINIANSTLIAGSAWSGPKFLATINLGNNTKVNSALNNHATFADVNVADGVEATKSNDNLADVTYTSFYADVTWANGSNEKWAHGSTPVAPSALTKVQKVVGGRTYSFTDAYASIPFSLSGNLTLGTDIAFNIYTSYDAPIEAVIVNGKTLVGAEKLINGTTLVWAYTAELDPAYSAAEFDIVFKMADGSTIVRAMSVADYASLVLANENSTDEAKDVVSNTLNYIKASSVYFGINADLGAIDSLLASNPAASYDLPTSSSTDASAVNAYVTSIQLNVMSTLRFRFNLADGVDGNGVIIKVGGEAKETIVTESYVEVELRAYELANTITIEYSGASGTTDLAYYCAAVLAGKGTSGTDARRFTMLYTRGNMLSAIYSYAMAAAAYKATV